ncbi:MAG: hypothetical protein CMJ89_07980 [Planctomycetes bacterium]|jgi:ABC-type transporter Mla subunit MlaD|nr:hypothetical protein [Planctomycetota bacterium]
MKKAIVNWTLHALLAVGISGLAACKSTTSNLSVGLDMSSDAPPPSLVERVHSIHEDYLVTHENLQTAHEIFRQLTAPQASELSRLSRKLKRQVKVCERDADQLARLIQSFSVETEQLVSDWENRLETVGDAERRQSKETLQETKEQTEVILSNLRRLQKKMQPVLVSLQDYLFFFEHNLHARAIAALDNTYETFGEEIEELVQFIVQAQGEVSTILTQLDPSTRPTRLAPAKPVDEPVHPDPVPVDPDPVQVDPSPPVVDPLPPVVPDPVSVDPADPNTGAGGQGSGNPDPAGPAV